MAHMPFFISEIRDSTLHRVILGVVHLIYIRIVAYIYIACQNCICRNEIN